MSIDEKREIVQELVEELAGSPSVKASPTDSNDLSQKSDIYDDQIELISVEEEECIDEEESEDEESSEDLSFDENGREELGVY